MTYVRIHVAACEYLTMDRLLSSQQDSDSAGQCSSASERRGKRSASQLESPGCSTSNGSESVALLSSGSKLKRRKSKGDCRRLWHPEWEITYLVVYDKKTETCTCLKCNKKIDTDRLATRLTQENLQARLTVCTDTRNLDTFPWQSLGEAPV